MDLNNRIKIMRSELNLKQEDFGKKINLTKFAISNYENGRTGIPDRVISDICREFNVNETWLRAGEGEMFVNSEISLMQWAGTVLGGSDESFKKRFVNMLSKLNEKDWETLEKIAILLDKNAK